MVFQKRLDYGFNGYQVLVIPRAARSARRRRSYAKKVEDNQMCAFDLLATVAGKLLLETETSPISIVDKALNKEHQDEEIPLKTEPYDEGSGDRTLLAHNQNYGTNAHSGLSSVLTGSECSERHCTEKIKLDGGSNEIIGCKVEVGSLADMETGDCKLESEISILMKDESDNMPIDIKAGMCSSDNSSKGPLYNEHVPFRSYNPSRDDVNVVSKDDDENSSGCTHPSLKTRFFRPSPRIGDRRIRKLLASRYWKVTPKSKNEKHLNTLFPDGGMKPVYRNRKNCYKHQRSQRDYPFKKRKIYYHSSISKPNGASGTVSSVAGQHLSFQSRESHVKLKIQSFIVPELFIEIPETETVGSLKRTVMEAVNAILGGGLHVGMLLQGKKVRDDHKTLQQTGISHDKHMEALGFTLEPTLSQGSPCLGPEDPPFLKPSDTPQRLTRYQPELASIRKGSTNTSSKLQGANLGNIGDSDRNSAPSSVDSSIDKNKCDSRALVTLPAMSVEALAMIPSHHKSRRSEFAQRRIRQPFSVTEVEALVQAVEMLGTGRWRDVKLRAFDNAKHRTYVDLKDKWKTLVHTARISPQQRRGEPVPQELLDRVLAAHAYWSQQHAKRQQETFLLL